MTVTTPVCDGQEMSWEEYESLGEDVRAEYVDGRVVISPASLRVDLAALMAPRGPRSPS